MTQETNLTKQEMSGTKSLTTFSGAQQNNDERSLIYNANFAPKIRDIATPEDATKLIDVIAEWRLYLGIKEQISVQELQFNATHIKESYPEFSIDMIRLAIKASLQGKLDVDIKPYGAFSPLYISTILNAYTRHNDKIINEVLREEANKKLQEVNSPKPLEGDQKVWSRYRYLAWYYSALTTETEYVGDINSVMWNFMVRNGFIDEKLVERENTKKYATRMLKRVRGIFDIELATADDWDIYLRYYTLRLYFRYLSIKKVSIPKKFSKEQLMA